MKKRSLYAKLPLLLVLGVSLIVSNGCKKEKEQEEDTSFTFTDSRDGVTYKAVRIGKQVWMAENLKYLPSVSVTAAGSETSPHYYVYGYNGTDVEAARATANYRNYGVLYNGPAARVACPPGWRLPGNDEWAALVDFVVSQGYPDQWDSPSGAANALKTCRQINSPLGGDCSTSDHPRWHNDDIHYGIDAFGFSALPGGTRDAGGYYGGLGYMGYWWSATSASAMNSGVWYIYNNYGNVISSIDGSYFHGLSVRCIRD